MHVQHLQLGQQRLADQLSERAHDPDLGLAGADSLHRLRVADPVGLAKLDAELAGGRGGRRRGELASPPPRAVRGSDDQDRPVRRGGQAAQHRDRELGGPQVDRSHTSSADVRGDLVRLGAVRGLLTQRPQRPLSLVALRSVEDQHPVQVIDLVLEDAGLEAGGLDQERLTAHIAAPHPRVQRALDVDRDPGQAEAALLGDRQLAGDPFQLRVDDRGRGGVEPRLHDQQAVHDPELGRRQAHAKGVAHDRDHLPGLAFELRPEARQLRGPRLQHRIPEGPNLGKRRRPALARLGVELGDGVVTRALRAERLLLPKGGRVRGIAHRRECRSGEPGRPLTAGRRRRSPRCPAAAAPRRGPRPPRGRRSPPPPGARP